MKSFAPWGLNNGEHRLAPGRPLDESSASLTSRRAAATVAKPHAAIQDEHARPADGRGVWLAEPIAVPWIEIRSTIRIASPADDARLAIWAEDLPRFSPLHATLRGAGTRLATTWERIAAAR